MAWTRRTKIALTAAALAAGGLPALAEGYSWHSGWGHGGWGQARHARHMDWCATERRPGLGEGMTLIEMHLALRPEQQDAWVRVVKAVERTGRERQTFCARPPGDTPSAMARLEVRMEAGLTAIRAIRPHLEALYAELDAEQRTRLDGLMRDRL